jgi:hemerythrin-like metal-binding protein
MALIGWRKEFETGIPDVDHEHMELVQLINELHDRLGEKTDPETVEEFLGEVFAKISAHFALEETVMRKYNYDEYEAHKAEHEKLLDEIRDIMDDYAAGKFTDYEERLATRVRDWFVNHFKTKDARLHRKLGV